MGGPVKGQADFLVLGDYNAACSMCGRKRKASELVRNWQGLYRCPIHNEPRQPQDFARGIKENMEVPWAQTEQIDFVEFNLTFPLSISPNGIVLGLGVDDIQTETMNNIILTESGIDISVEPAYNGTVVAILPSYIIPETFLWSWLTGGVGIIIDSPTAVATELETLDPTATGVLQLTVTSSLGGIATATINVSA